MISGTPGINSFNIPLLNSAEINWNGVRNNQGYNFDTPCNGFQFYFFSVHAKKISHAFIAILILDIVQLNLAYQRQ